MTVYRFQLSKFAVLGCIAGILLGLGAAGYTAYRIWRNLYSELSVQLVLQYAVVLLVAVLALVIFISVLAHSVYKITDKQIVLRFGIIKSVYTIADIVKIHRFTKTNKLVLYFKDQRFTVVVVKPEWYGDFVQDILARMKFADQVERLSDPDAPLLYQVIKDFCSPKADMSPDKIKAVDMGYIFENLIQRFSESYDEDAGAHFTSRDIVYLMTDLLIAADPHVFDGDHIVKTVYDQTMGTSQMLGCTEERLRQLDADARVTCFGQEFNPFTFGIAKASALIRGEDDQNMQFGDTLSADKFDGFRFDYCISNPPFGDPWNPQAQAVEKEHKSAGGGRFPVKKLPAKGDGQMLFTLNGLSKLKDGGVMAIVQDASPLYKGKPESGEDCVRRYILENDWLDAIVQLPTDSFYNTGIATYIWLLSKGKPDERKDKVLLVDASKCFEKRRKGIGDKKNDITKVCRDLIVKAYGAYTDGVFSDIASNGSEIVCETRVMETVEFGFNRVAVETPLYDEDGKPVLKKGKPVADKAKEDTEDIPLNQDIDAYIEREVKPYNPDAWVDPKKTKVGYTIPFTRVFYKYRELEPADDIAQRILQHEKELETSLEALFGEVR